MLRHPLVRIVNEDLYNATSYEIYDGLMYHAAIDDWTALEDALAKLPSES